MTDSDLREQMAEAISRAARAESRLKTQDATMIRYETALAAACDVIEKVTPCGYIDDGVRTYLVSCGPIHRLVAALQSAGLSVGLRADRSPATTTEGRYDD